MSKNAEQLVRRAESGEVVTITVSGRPVATLAPIPAQTWQEWSDVADLFSGPVDTSHESVTCH